MVDHSYAFETNDRGTWEIRVATLFSVLILLQFATHIYQLLFNPIHKTRFQLQFMTLLFHFENLIE